ncbi:MAG: hypothetical protein K1X64_02690 [Myxococcaceae bacterium]|nr:hypothetical protein [Myxococcaceae bacterium]
MGETVRSVGVFAVLLLAACAHQQEKSRWVSSASLCAAGFESLESGACLAVPPGAGAQTPVVMFLHGMYPEDAPAAELDIEARLAKLAVAHGFSVLVFRGELGLCDWSADFAHWRCWPSQAKQKAKAGELLVKLGAHFRAVSARLKLSPVRPFVMGFSNGGFFAALLAAETKLDVRGFGILHGGPVEPAVFLAERAVPSLLISAAGDQWQGPKMKRLHQLMEQGGWAHTYEVRAGEHQLTDADIEQTLLFFASHR